MKIGTPALLLAALAIGGCSQPAATPRTLTFGLDGSEGNPFIEHDTAAQAAAKFAQKEVAALSLGDTVEIRRFGMRKAENMQVQEFRLTRKLRPETAAASVARYIAALPSTVKDGDNQTNILAFLEFSAFDCAGGERLVLFTDGIEASKTLSERAFLSGRKLPAPGKPGFLKGCEVVMFLGQNERLSPKTVAHIRASWEEYFKAASAEFTVFIDG